MPIPTVLFVLALTGFGLIAQGVAAQPLDVEPQALEMQQQRDRALQQTQALEPIEPIQQVQQIDSTPPADALLADVTVLVFENGLPVPDVSLAIAESTGATSLVGLWEGQVPPGTHTLVLSEKDNTLARLRLNLAAEEILQIIVTLKGQDREAFVSIESSRGLLGERLIGQASQTVLEGQGQLVGVVRSTEDDKVVENARLFVSGTAIEAVSDAEGRFEISLPVGQYSVSILHGEFATRTVEGVVVAKDESTQLDFSLPPAGLELAEYVVLVPFIQGSISAVLDERLRSASVSEVLGAEQMSRAGDSDAGSALARVTGLTLVGGEFIFVRGLGERYSATLLNRASVPSPDPSRKVVPMSLFPTGVIESIRVQKSYSPDMPGEFGGGSVDIRTNSIPDENFFNISLSGGFLQRTTGKKGLTYQGGSNDWLGRDDGTRALPDVVAEAIAGDVPLIQANVFNPVGFSAEELAVFGQAFPVIYDIDEKKNSPDHGASIEAGWVFEQTDWSVGFLTALSWDQSWSNRNEIRREYIIGEGELRLADDYALTRTEHSVDASGFLTAGLEYKEDHELTLTSILLRQTIDDVNRQVGFDLDTGGITDTRSLAYEERDLLSHQIQGRHRFSSLSNFSIHWDASRARARSITPDQRIHLFQENARSPTGFVFSRRTDNNFRNYGDLGDESIEYGVDIELPVTFGPVDLTIKGGWRELNRDRNFNLRRFKFGGIERVSPDIRFLDSLEEIINASTIGPRGFVIGESTRPTDNSTALLDIEAFYGMLDVSLFERFRISGGVRVEDWTQSANTFRLFDPNNSPITAELASKDWLPSASLTYYLTERQQVIASYGETIIRPDLRELSPAEFTDPVLDRPIRGNPDLIQSDIRHYDLRYDFSPTPTELVSLGLFYKEIINPIETTIIPSEAFLLSFANAQGAENYGVEFELRKNLGFMGRWVWGGVIWDRLTVAGNVSWVESNIKITEQGALTSTDRALQGQSPYVLNGQLAYANEDSGLEMAVLYNVAGERISEVGVLGQPDQYAQPFHQLDFTWAWSFSDRAKLKFKAQNLLDSKFKVTQGDKVTQQYQKGIKLSVGLDVLF